MRNPFERFGKILLVGFLCGMVCLSAEFEENRIVLTPSTVVIDSPSLDHSIDGNIHAFDEEGVPLWTSTLGGPLLSVSIHTPENIQIQFPDMDILSPQSLDPRNIKDLVASAPFQGREGIAYLGSKSSRMWGLDRSSGEILASFSPREFECTQDDLMINELPEAVWVTRTDYVLHAVDTLSGRTLWNVSFGEFIYGIDGPSGIPLLTLSDTSSSHHHSSGSDHGIVLYSDGTVIPTSPVSPSMYPTHPHGDDLRRNREFEQYLIISTTAFVTLVSILGYWFIIRRYYKSVANSKHISVDTSLPLGLGSHGTVVYQGTYQGREVAVKRLLAAFYPKAEQEIELLVDSDTHPNVLRYFATEEDGDFIYLALERCQLSLAEYIYEMETCLKPSVEIQQSILLQSLAGLGHLHSLGIVHRDIKPHNLLLQSVEPSVTVKIADMGLGKKLDGASSFSALSSVGSSGWTSPEVLNGDKLSKKVDIFSMGCVMYFVLSGGKHPFGDVHERDHNIMHGRYDLSGIESYEAIDILQRMLSMDPMDRPNVDEIIQHPFFWSYEQRLEFLCSFSDAVEREASDSLRRRVLEQSAPKLVGGRWDKLLPPSLLESLGKYRKYNYSSLRDLLRVVRNKRNHYRDLSPEAQKDVGDLPQGFLQTFLNPFPRLLLFAFYFVISNVDNCRNEFPNIYGDEKIAVARLDSLFGVSEEREKKIMNQEKKTGNHEKKTPKKNSSDVVYSKNWRKR